MVRHGIWPGKYRCCLAILAVAVGEEERVYGRKAVRENGVGTHIATLDDSSIQNLAILGKDKLLGADIHAHGGATSYGAIFELRDTLDCRPILDI